MSDNQAATVVGVIKSRAEDTEEVEATLEDVTSEFENIKLFVDKLFKEAEKV